MLPTQQNNSIATAKIIYIFLIVGTLIGLSAVVAVVMAYLYMDNAPAWMKTHYRYQIRTFWIGLLYTVIGIITFAIGIGKLLIMFTVVWAIVRCIKGMKQLDREQPVTNPESWLFS